MRFIARWLDLRGQRRPVGLRPHGQIEIERSAIATAELVRRAIADVLGAHIAYDDGSTIEGAFGLVQSERIRCSISSLEEGRTQVRADAIYPPGSEIPQRSAALDALLAALARD